MFADPDLKKCAQIVVYPVSFAPLDPEYYAIYFDRDKRDWIDNDLGAFFEVRVGEHRLIASYGPF